MFRIHRISSYEKSLKIVNVTSYDSTIQAKRMVKVKDFRGAVFHPEDYSVILNNNIEHLQTVPMSKIFNTAEMIASGRLYPQKQNFFYIYHQFYQNHNSYGILAGISLEDYHNNKIKKHQKTLNRPGLNYKTYLHDHVGPVVVSHRKDENINKMIATLTTSHEAFSRWNTNDGRQHALWRIRKSEAKISEKFVNIQNLYILDGHHRLQAAHQNYLLSDKNSETDLWMQAIIYSSQYVVIHPQHRVLENIPQKLQIINQIMGMDHLEITDLVADQMAPLKIKEELQKYEVVLKMHKKIYGINFKNICRNILDKVSTVRLQNQIFSGCLSEQMVKKIKYVPGIIQQQKIYLYDIVFFVRHSEIETIFQIADELVTMPPKSTWIEPKPCSHMVVRLFR